MGDERDLAETQAAFDMAYCIRCGGYDPLCGNPSHVTNPRAREVPDPVELPGLGGLLNRLAYGPNPDEYNHCEDCGRPWKRGHICS